MPQDRGELVGREGEPELYLAGRLDGQRLGWPRGVAAGQDAFGLQHEQAFAGRDGHGSGRRRRSRVAARGLRAEGELDQAGSVADQVKPPGAERRYG